MAVPWIWLTGTFGGHRSLSGRWLRIGGGNIDQENWLPSRSSEFKSATSTESRSTSESTELTYSREVPAGSQLIALSQASSPRSIGLDRADGRGQSEYDSSLGRRHI